MLKEKPRTVGDVPLEKEIEVYTKMMEKMANSPKEEIKREQKHGRSVNKNDPTTPSEANLHSGTED